MANRRLVIAGTGSGVGKTTITLGLMAALQKKGYTVQGYKCGPDYIDPTYHSAVTGRISRNLDSWMFDKETVTDIVAKNSNDADISIIEGVMGFFDGKSPTSNNGSAAEISVLTESPVILVVNCASMARSVAAIVKGFQTFSSEPKIVGVIANRVGSEGHYKIVKTAIEQECGIPVLGYVKKENDIDIPSRHLGLVPAIERGELDAFFETLGNLMLETVDLEKLVAIAETTPIIQGENSIFNKHTDETVAIAVAKDAAFNFYYQENFELLEAYGAKLHFFSPLKGESVPADADGLYIGGGFPEEFAAELAKEVGVKQSIKKAIESGLPTLAECGGYMYLTNSITDTNGEVSEMVGIIPGDTTMQTKRAALGYREIKGTEENFLFGPDEQVKGHEFHYSTYKTTSTYQPAYETKGRSGVKQEGYALNNLVAGYTHLHFASNPKVAEQWVQACSTFKKSKIQ
ncbi:cobyrinate a,c-diamide synthase [Bacillus massiliigorillae]|uniref:cobyrinate a,c-diamide synthase n=1 Tax=Bacillus massiliigorillae TaxID=1243664 RepID=UPI0003A1578D|nr:cobyrinate a,c-diamide synthase [Bacillus massiliigorillae]